MPAVLRIFEYSSKDLIQEISVSVLGSFYASLKSVI